MCGILTFVPKSVVKFAVFYYSQKHLPSVEFGCSVFMFAAKLVVYKNMTKIGKSRIFFEKILGKV